MNEFVSVKAVRIFFAGLTRATRHQLADDWNLSDDTYGRSKTDMIDLLMDIIGDLEEDKDDLSRH